MAPDRGVEPAPDDIVSSDLTTENVAEVASPDPTIGQALPPHLSHDPTSNAKRTDPFQFGQRYLKTSDDVFEYNAWDHVEPDDEHIAFSEAQYAMQRASPVTEFDRQRFNTHPEKWWDLFYKQKTSTFFKDRKWLVQEFPILKEVTTKGAGKKVVLEVGAGAGNTAFPLARMNENEALEIIAVDFSKKAVETMQNAPEYEGGQSCVRAEIWDASSEELPADVSEASVDVVVMIFIFSALNPRQWTQAVKNVWRILKPGGEVLFRDYGRGDLAQVRFKAGRWMEENFYVRGDGTRVYFFDKDELEQIWRGTNHIPSRSSTDDDHGTISPGFEVLNLDVDRRLIVNRQRRIKMYRCWIQGKFRKAEQK